MLKNELVKAYFLSRSVSYTALITVVSWVLSSSALSNMTNICHMFVLSPSPQRQVCAVECLDLIFLIIINTHARNTLLNIHAREERSDKFVLLLGLKLVSSMMFP